MWGAPGWPRWCPVSLGPSSAFSSSRLFKHAALGFRFRSTEGKHYKIYVWYALSHYQCSAFCSLLTLRLAHLCHGVFMHPSQMQTMEMIRPAQELSLSHEKTGNHPGISYECENLTGVKITSYALIAFSSFQGTAKVHSMTHFVLPSPMVAQPRYSILLQFLL